MLGLNDYSNIDAAIQDVKQKYVNCLDCKSSRNCCSNFTPEFSLKFDQKQAETLFSQSIIDNLAEEGNLIFTGQGYELISGKCPMLDDKQLCGAHQRKKELNLNICEGFPIYTIVNMQRLNKQPIKEKIIVADYRCFGVEHDWKQIQPNLAKISADTSINAYVKFKHKNKTRLLPLTEFEISLNNGIIESQTL
ncbi:hypothetical protein HOK51_03990 [Candidatus Woesearchaeota archaeon]|mgnify:CR=1 FL=1|jgi:hypothetical protein|nr:hypothetical protein [Candidatus Woesearchaeota archaeon]MBT6518983.1 hypothetical protein [Candidatus Woesearchaeota archaeon]MBT7368348.1 hypothetical protein [Candidatus Woesearchaeota archaeon]